ncbi:MAG: 16S rRNA (cytosine(1402)-N(4))-methyltransferase RsmH [Sedimentisphaerales bacterium]|nr:16S rRNA (cytosine(1402)-N(4))-methyltransferase RsmH [Sedimentisphaerales bacterium]
MNGSTVEHVPVLAGTLAEQIDLPPDGVMVDATIGHGGHSLLFGRNLGPEGVIIGLDVDEDSIRRARLKLADLKCRVALVHSNFTRIAEQLRKQGIEKADFILADLGLCSGQLADPGMGLSFQANMPLDMRIDKRIKTTAADIINEADEKCLADLIYRFGQDRASRRIARFIVRQRVNEPITTTEQLAAIVCSALARPGKKRRNRIHPATRTFQAFRIAVNNELDNIEHLLVSSPDVLRKGGSIAVISYHSLEDRMVKRNFRQNAQDDIYAVLTKKPIVPSDAETRENPRARSAKLRIARRK